YTFEYVAGRENAFPDFLSRSDEKDKPRGGNREGNEEKVDEKLKTEAECMTVMRAMTRQMLETKTQETFINPPPPTPQDIGQVPQEAKKQSELFSLDLVKKQQLLDSKLVDIFRNIGENSSKKYFDSFDLERKKPIGNSLKA
uniref:Uncharacterized protein n=1 Tax=Romanomermis culicivorax TaxID=13658 RepID=A0A915K4K3_ROMCU